MKTSLRSDDRGVILSCPACGTTNRVAYSRLGDQGRCGTCKADLPPPNAPVEIASLEAFQGLVAESPVPVLMDFWADWCGPCQMMAPEFAKAAAIASGRLVLAKLNTEQLPQVAGSLRIQGIPAFILFKNGREAARIAGFQPAAQLVQWAGSV